MAVIAAQAEADQVMDALRAEGEAPYVIGRLVPRADTPVRFTGEIAWPA